MTADDLDELISSTQHRYADAIETGADPIPGVVSRARQIRRKRRAAIAIGFTAVTAAALIGVVNSDLLPGHENNGASIATAPEATTASTSPTPTTTPAPLTREEALRRQLATNDEARMALIGSENPQGTVLCGVNVVGSDASQTELYVWVLCGSFTTGQDAQLMSGGSAAAVVSVSGHGAATHITSVRFPRQETLNEDISAMFPPAIANEMQRGDLPVRPTMDQLLAEAGALPPASS